MTKTRLSKALALCIATSSVFSTNMAQADTFPVTESNDDGTGLVANSLSWAILQANQTPGADEILLQTDVTITGVMKRLIDSDTTLTSDATRRTISGNDEFRPLFIKSGQVTIKDLDVTNGLSKGGESSTGGAGAGLGGALFIYEGQVTIENVNLHNNKAQGGENSECDYAQCRAGGGMFGKSALGGGGLFADSQAQLGGYSGYHQYQNNDSEFGQGGNGSPMNYSPALSGGFGGGGGNGYYAAGGHGGFGGGGGSTYDYYSYLLPSDQQYSAGDGGFGAGGGTAWWSSNHGQAGFGGHKTLAAGLGGAIFIRSGQMTLSNSSIENNLAIQSGSGENTSDGLGGGIFVLHTVQNTNGNNQGMPNSLPVVEFCNVSFANNLADTDTQLGNNNDNIFDLSNSITQLPVPCLTTPEITLYSEEHVISDGDITPSTSDFTNFGATQINIATISRSFSVTNTGQGELNLTGTPVIEIQSPSGQFSITQQPSNNVLNYNDEVTFEVTFNPSTVGSDTATIVISNNDSDENPYDFVIAAEGIAPQPKLLVTQNGQAIVAEDETPSSTDGTDFGYTPVAGGLIEQSFEIHNVGFAPLQLINHTGSIHTISQDNSMSISSQLAQFELQPNESVPFTVAFDPVQVGPASTNYVNITSNDPDFADYYFQVTGYGQATMYLNSLQTDVQEGEDLVFEIATDLPLFESTLVQFSLTGEVQEEDFDMNGLPMTGEFFLPASQGSTQVVYSTRQDGITEGLELLSFGILSKDPAINQVTPFIAEGSIDDDLIYHNGFEIMTVSQLNKKLNQQAEIQVITCDYSLASCTFLGQQFRVNDYNPETRMVYYTQWLRSTIQTQQPQSDWDNDGVINGQDPTPFGITFDIIGDHDTE